MDLNRINRCEGILTRSRNPIKEKAAETSWDAAVTALLRLNNRGKIRKKTGHRNTVFLL